MTSRLLFFGTFLSAIGAGISGGVFFAFSTFVMPALARVPPAQGVAVMQAIDVTVYNAAFMLALVGTAGLSGLLALVSLGRLHEPGAAFRIAGAVVYVAGAIAVTRIFHIPRNEALAALPPDGAATAAYWQRYLAEWTFWNHVRTVGCIAGSALFIAALAGRRP